MKYEPKLLQERLDHLSALPNIKVNYKNDFHPANVDQKTQKYLIIETLYTSLKMIHKSAIYTWVEYILLVMKELLAEKPGQ